MKNLRNHIEYSKINFTSKPTDWNLVNKIDPENFSQKFFMEMLEIPQIEALDDSVEYSPMVYRTKFSNEFIESCNGLFVFLDGFSGGTYLIDTQGYNYPRYVVNLFSK